MKLRGSPNKNILMTVVATVVATAAVGCQSDLDSLDEGESQLRYIPSYTNACMPEDRESYLAVRNVLAQATANYEWKVAHTMEMCNENSCSPCTTEQNPMLQVLRDYGSWGSGEMTAVSAVLAPSYIDMSNPSAGPLEVYFAQALAYPWRKLLLGLPPGAQGSTQVSLAQGVQHSCAEGIDCNEYRLAIESLESSCESMAVTVPVNLSESGSNLMSLGQSPNAFGFQVPLTSSLPEPSSFNSVAELEFWLEEIASVTVDMSEAEVEWSQDGPDSYCATVRGKVDADVFDDIAQSPTAVDEYAGADGHISTVLSLRLSSTTVVSD